jgi:hypothetical protein
MNSMNFIDLNDLINDYIDKINIIKNKHLSLLSELSIITELDTNLYLDQVKKIGSMGNIFVSYIDNPLSENFDIIASGTIIIEPKLIRGGKSVGHIEDIVVSEKYRGNGISKNILEMLKKVARRERML